MGDAPNDGRVEDDRNDGPKGGRPGPTDQGRTGGMATRENAPEITKRDDD